MALVSLAGLPASETPQVRQAVEAALAALPAEFGPNNLRYRPKPGPPTSLRHFVDEQHIFSVATDEPGRRQNRVEAAGRAWAVRSGVNCPAVLACAADGSWLLASLVAPAQPVGPDYVRAGLAAADLLADTPPPALPDQPTAWRGSRRTLVARAVRTTAGGLLPTTFLRSRRAAGALGDLVTCHGDFYHRNVLAELVAGRTGVSVVDWEFLAPAPRFTDHLRFWSTLPVAADRALAWEAIQDRRPAAEHLLTLATWLSDRLLAENLAAPGGQRNPVDLARARQVRTELRALRGGGSVKRYPRPLLRESTKGTAR